MGHKRSPGVVDYLRNYIDGPLEVMVATHPHADHIGGLIAVLSAFEVEQIWHNGDNSTSKTYRDFMYLVGSEGAETYVAKLLPHQKYSTELRPTRRAMDIKFE